MVDFDAVWGELKRTGYTGVGVFLSAQTGDILDDIFRGRFGALGIGTAQYAAGTAGAFVASTRMDAMRTRGFTFNMGEALQHVSYGIGGAGFDEGARAFRSGQSTGASADVVEVSRSVGQSAETAEEAETFMLENA